MRTYMPKSIKLGFTVCAVLLAGCATPPFASESALKVQVQRQYSTMLEACKRLDPVTARIEMGSTGWTHNPYEIATITAENQIREKVAAAGGDTVVFTTRDVVPPGRLQFRNT
jgi:hypothetical protein